MRFQIIQMLQRFLKITVIDSLCKGIGFIQQGLPFLFRLLVRFRLGFCPCIQILPGNLRHILRRRGSGRRFR